jgi:hypothetical protein
MTQMPVYNCWLLVNRKTEYDDYWMHGGSIKDVFKTIKYGV